MSGRAVAGYWNLELARNRNSLGPAGSKIVQSGFDRCTQPVKYLASKFSEQSQIAALIGGKATAIALLAAVLK